MEPKSTDRVVLDLDTTPDGKPLREASAKELLQVRETIQRGLIEPAREAMIKALNEALDSGRYNPPLPGELRKSREGTLNHETLMPNGKKLGDCNKKDVQEIGALFLKLADEMPSNEKQEREVQS